MQKSIVNQTVVNRFLDPFEVLRTQFTWNLKGNSKIIQACGTGNLVRSDADDCPFRRQFAFSQVLRGVKTCARTEGSEEQLGRSHSFVEAAVFRWLVARDNVLPRSDLKLNSAKMFYLDFH